MNNNQSNAARLSQVVAAFVVIASVLTGGIASPAQAAQETRFDAVGHKSLVCEGVGCGALKAVLNATAVKDSPGARWSRQGKIDLIPFMAAARINGTTVSTPDTLCLEVFADAYASHSISGTTAPFGDLPYAFDEALWGPTVTGNLAQYWGKSCITPSSNQAVLKVYPENAYVFFGGRNKIDKIALWVRTSATWGGTTIQTKWAKDTINFG